MGDDRTTDRGTFHGVDVEEFLDAVESVISKGDRAEIVPVKKGIKVLRVRRINVEDEKKN